MVPCMKCLASSKCFLFVLSPTQFLTFTERLANVNIDVIHRIDRTGSYAEVCAACTQPPQADDPHFEF